MVHARGSADKAERGAAGLSEGSDGELGLGLRLLVGVVGKRLVRVIGANLRDRDVPVQPAI